MARVDDILIRLRAESNLSNATNDLKALGAMEDQLRLKTDEAAEAMKRSTDTTNTGSKEQVGALGRIRAEIDKLKIARELADDPKQVKAYTAQIGVLENSFRNLTSTTNVSGGSVKNLNKEVDSLDVTSNRTGGTFRNMATLIAGAFAIDKVLEFGQSLLGNEGRLESSRLALRNVIGSQEAYAQSLIFLSKLSDDYGQDILALTDSYKGFIASSNSSGLALSERNKIYESIIKSGSALHLNNEQIQGSLLAVSQMFSKGNVSAEELRGQLGERLPGAFGIMAKALGVNEKQLNKMLEQGEVLAKDALPKFATALEEAYGKNAKSNIESLTGSSNRFYNQIKENFDQLNKGVGITKGIANGFNFMADNMKALITTGKTLIATWIAYEVVTRTSSVATAVRVGWEKLKLIAIGESIIATEAYTGITIAETEAQIAATVAARAFNTALASNPIGLVVLAVGALVTGYQIYSSSVEAAKEEQEKFNKQVGEAVVPIKLEQVEFNRLALAVLNTNAKYDDRLKAFEQLKSKFPEQLSGIDNLKEAESKLGAVIRSTNNDFVVRAKLLENEVRIKHNTAIAEAAITEKILLESQLKNASTKGTSMVVGTSGQVTNFASEASVINARIAIQDKAIQEATKYNANIAEQSEKLTKKLVYDWKEQNDAAGGNSKATGKANKEKIDSMKTLALIQDKNNLEVLEKTRVNEQKILKLEQQIAIQRINESKASLLKKNNEIDKINDDFFKRSSKLTDKYDEIEQKELEKSNKEKLDAQYKSLKETIEISQKTMAEVQKINQKKYEELLKLDENYAKDSKELMLDKTELADKLRLLDKISHAKNSKEIVEIEAEENLKKLQGANEYYKNRLFLENLKLTRLRYQYGEDSVEYKKQREIVMEADKAFTESSIALTEEMTNKKKKAYEKDAENFRQIIGVVTQIADQLFSAIDKQIDDRLSKATDSVEKNMLNSIKAESKIAKDGLSAIVSFASGDIAGGISKGITAIFESINLAINRTANYEKAVIERQQELIKNYAETAKNNIEGIVNQLNDLNNVYGNLAQTAFISTKNNGQYVTEIQAANNALKEQAKSLEDYASKLGQRGFTATELINKEIAYGQAVLANYNNALNKENELYNSVIKGINDKYDLAVKNENAGYDLKVKNENSDFDLTVKNINSTYDLEIQKINAKYDLIATRANQAYSAETLGILQAGTAQLEALITNEISLDSVRKEFAAKRLNILNAFPLANKAITEGMSEAEVKAINDSITARDAALAKLQGWYNTELITITKNEGQKRTEYSATEKIQNDINGRLEAAALVFQGNEIQRIADKEVAIKTADNNRRLSTEVAEKSHKLNLQVIEAEHNAVISGLYTQLKADLLVKETSHNAELKRLAEEKDAAILASFQRLQAGIETELNRVSGLLSAINDKTSQEYKDLQAQLDALIGKYKELVGVNPTITITDNGGGTSRGPRGFAVGTEYVPLGNNRMGVDTVPARLTVGERVMTVEQNMRLGRISNEDLVRRNMAFEALFTTPSIASQISMDMPQLKVMNPDKMIDRRSVEYLMNMNLEPLRKEMAGLKDELRNVPKQTLNITEEGFYLMIESKNHKEKRITSRFKG